MELNDPPYLQIALDEPSLENQIQLIEALPESKYVILEAGTPLVKKYGAGVVENLREKRNDAFIIADLKTLDTGKLETKIAAEAGANGVVVSGLAANPTIKDAIREAEKRGMYCIVDTLNVNDPLKMAKNLDVKPHIIELHRGIDQEESGEKHSAWDDIPQIKDLTQENLVAVAGGITPETATDALEKKANVLVVGRAITNSQNPGEKTQEFLEILEKVRVD